MCEEEVLIAVCGATINDQLPKTDCSVPPPFPALAALLGAGAALCFACGQGVSWLAPLLPPRMYMAGVLEST